MYRWPSTTKPDHPDLPPRFIPAAWEADIARKVQEASARAGPEVGAEVAAFAAVLFRGNPDGEPWHSGSWRDLTATPEATGALWYFAIDRDWRFRSYVAGDLRLPAALRDELSVDWPQVAEIATAGCPGGAVDDDDRHRHAIARDATLPIADRVEALAGGFRTRSERAMLGRGGSVPADEHIENCVFPLLELAAGALAADRPDVVALPALIAWLERELPQTLRVKTDGWYRLDEERAQAMRRVGRWLNGDDRAIWSAACARMLSPTSSNDTI